MKDIEQHKVSADEQRVLRAWRLSIIAFFLVPVVLHLYALWLIRKVKVNRLSARSRRQYWMTIVISILSTIIIIMLIISILS